MKQVIVIEDDREFAATMAEFLEESGEIKVVAVLDNEQTAREFLRSPSISSIDCALVDLRLPRFRGDNETNSRVGLSLIRDIKQESHHCKILVVTSTQLFEDGERAITAGCDGYLCKHASPSEIPVLVEELKLAISGEVMVIPRQMRYVFLREELSAKEARLMELVDRGHSWAQIAGELGYRSPGVASTIGYRVFDKLLSPEDIRETESNEETRRDRALERWRARVRKLSPDSSE